MSLIVCCRGMAVSSGLLWRGCCLVYPSLLQLKDKRVIVYKREFIKRIFNILNGTQSGI